MKNNIKLPVLIFFLIAISIDFCAQNQTNESAEIKNIIAKKRDYNERYGYGFRIQLYNGNEQKSRKIRARFRAEFPGYITKLVYKSPEWKVQVGNYKTKLEADKDLLIFREKFSGIIVIPMGK
ncbi:SPOR domain-containing protein [Polaribacter sp. WD7]|uniref:SPOR domain-containing protein n=1 Tax=Polaribacter sp. WD7 TaxID=2269061 RepID=UPI000DF2E098|nr:SPOR domain-containing protein [Polaribacter sp. WD7]RCS26257.1 SPOR domain-containing protein [Polaribacter sp. WD7]